MSVVVAEPQQATLSVIEFIEARGFNVDQLYVDRFWSSVSEDQWISVTTELLRWMGYTHSRERQMKERYLLLLSAHFVRDEDFKQLSASALDNFIVHPGVANEVNHHHNVKHLVVSCDCFKESLMLLSTDRAKEVRKYYLTLEKVFKAYVKYQHELTIRNHEQETARLQQRVDEMETLQADLANMAIDTTPVEYTEHVYVLTSKRYYQLSLFKIGRTQHLKHRLSSYNTGNALSADEHFYLCSIATSDSLGLEKQLHRVLGAFKLRREWFKMHPRDLISIVKFVSNQQDALRVHVNHLVRNQVSTKDAVELDKFDELVKSSVSSVPILLQPNHHPRSNVAVRLLLHFYEGMKDDKSVKYKKDTLYSIYNGWAEREGEKVVPCTSLVAMLKDLGFCQSSQKEKQSDGSRKSARMFRLDRAMIKSHLGEFIEYDEDCDGCD